MKNVYPIVLTEGTSFIVVHIPDFDIGTQGADLADAMKMARDAIGLAGIDMEDDGVSLPVPSNISSVQSAYPDATVTLVDVDFSEYRRKNDLRTVKKNCTIPSWLNFEAEQAGVNFSAVLQAGLKRELKLAD